MAIRPKEGAMVRFRQIGESEEKTGKVVSISKPQFQRHLLNTQYEIDCDGKTIYIDSFELIRYEK